METSLNLGSYLSVTLIAILVLIGWFIHKFSFCTCVRQPYTMQQQQQRPLLLDDDTSTTIQNGRPSLWSWCACCLCLATWQASEATKYVCLSSAHAHKYKTFEMSPTPLNELITLNSTCMICLEDFKLDCEVISLACRHGYHKHCLRDWVLDKDVARCPLCSHVIKSQTILIGPTFSTTTSWYLKILIWKAWNRFCNSRKNREKVFKLHLVS